MSDQFTECVRCGMLFWPSEDIYGVNPDGYVGWYCSQACADAAGSVTHGIVNVRIAEPKEPAP